jgi:hypothetical protein
VLSGKTFLSLQTEPQVYALISLSLLAKASEYPVTAQCLSMSAASSKAFVGFAIWSALFETCGWFLYENGSEMLKFQLLEKS